MNNNCVEHFENEDIKYKNKIYKPKYSVKEADNLSKKILKKIYKSKKKKPNKQTRV